MAQRQTGKGYIKKIDFVFYHEKDLRDAVNEFKLGTKSQGKNGSGIGDPTATQAMRNMMPLRYANIDGDMLEWPESWVRVIDATYGWCNNDQYIVAKDRYSGVDYRVSCAKLSISEKRYYLILDDVRHRASLCAVQYGLIKVC